MYGKNYKGGVSFKEMGRCGCVLLFWFLILIICLCIDILSIVICRERGGGRCIDCCLFGKFIVLLGVYYFYK